MAFTVGMPPCFQALSVEDPRRALKALSGNACASPGFSSFLGEKVRFNQSSGKLYLYLSQSAGACRCSPAQGSHSSLKDGWPKKSDGSSYYNSDSLRRLNALEFQSSAVATANYTVAEDELRRGGNSTILGKDGQKNAAFFVNDKSVKDSELGDMLHVDGQTKSDNDENAISRLGVNKAIVDALEKRGITHLFPIQRAVLKPAMQGRDLIARAKTGTGKTLAFAIPIIHQILKEKEEGRTSRVFGRTPRALILAPTRELAKQVEKELMESAPSLSTLCVYGGVSITSQQRQLARGVDVAVGTPGRVIDLIDRGSLKLSTVQFMVLDEADQMLAVGFEEDVEKIMEQLQEGHQSMLFSATMPGWVKKLSRKFMQDPITIDLVGESDEKLAEGIKLYSISTISAAKRGILNDLIMVYGRGGKSIVFTQTKKDADEVSQALSRLVGCEALHGDITQNRRESIMKSFRDGKFSVLVATDVAARGLDISDVDLIIHYEIPNDPETFVHRSGRTGRAGKEGTAILMHTQQERRTLFRIEQDVGCKFEQIDPPHVSDVLRSSSAHATAAISKVHPEVKKYFLPTAEQLLEDKGIDALAAAIAHISGFSQPPVSRSLITHEEGSMTLRIVRSGRGGPPLISARSVMGTLAEIYPIATQNMGKICMIDEPNVEGAVFDLPEDVAKELLTKQMNPGDSIDVPAKLPRIQEDFSGRSSYGRFSSRGSFSGRGGQDFDFRGQGGRPSSRFRAQDDSFGYGGRTRSRDDDRFDRTFSRSVDRTRSMGGACFVCGQVGHKAVDCPEKRRR